MRVTFFADTVDGGRAKACIALPQRPPVSVIHALINMLGTEHEVQGNGRAFKFYCSCSHVNPVKFDLMKQVLHRQGYERFDDVWDGENADELFGYDIRQ
jgi:hypothetical protein